MTHRHSTGPQPWVLVRAEAPSCSPSRTGSGPGLSGGSHPLRGCPPSLSAELPGMGQQAVAGARHQVVVNRAVRTQTVEPLAAKP